MILKSLLFRNIQDEKMIYILLKYKKERINIGVVIINIIIIITIIINISTKFSF